MLSYDELKNVARLKRLSLVNAEKDYLQELILFVLYSKLGREFIFKGGTCLYKAYKINRFSEDLDFTLTKYINIKRMVDKLIFDFKFLNIKVRIKEIKEYTNEKNIRLLINGPLYRGSKETQCYIQLNISLRENVVLQPNFVKLSSLYKDISDFNIFAMKENEILAEKVRAVLLRDKPRDVYDVWFLLNRGVEFDSELINKKLKIHNIKFNPPDFIKAINRKKEFWNTDLKELIIGELPKFEDVLKYIKSKL